MQLYHTSLNDKTPVVVVLLDLTAVFNRVTHTVLISCLNEFVGIQGVALKCFSFYLTIGTFSVMTGRHLLPLFLVEFYSWPYSVLFIHAVYRASYIYRHIL